MLWVRGFGSLCLFNLSSDFFVLFIDIFSTCCRFAYCRTFICTDIRFELVSLLFFVSDIFFTERTVVLACCRTSILTDIRLVLLSCLYYPVVHCGRALFAQPLFGYFFFFSCVGRSGRTGEPGESIVDVSVGR